MHTNTIHFFTLYHRFFSVTVHTYIYIYMVSDMVEYKSCISPFVLRKNQFRFVSHCHLPLQVQTLLPVLNFTITALVSPLSFSCVGHTRPVIFLCVLFENIHMHDSLFCNNELCKLLTFSSFIVVALTIQSLTPLYHVKELISVV